MKNINCNMFCLVIAGLVLLVSCKKDSENIFNMFSDVSVTFHGDNPLSVVDYKQVNDGDSVYIDYTINSAKEDMYFIGVERVAGASSSASPERTVSQITDDSQRRSYSGVIKLKMQRDGKTSYRIYALNRQNIYIGDGYKKVTIDVNASYIFVNNRRVYLPDDEGSSHSFYSIERDETFSYNNGQVNSADIDFGVWVKADLAPSRLNQPIYNLYSISHTPNPFPAYNVSSWQKRATKFSTIRMSASNTFLYNLVSNSTIMSAAAAANPNLTSIEGTTSLNGLVPASLVYFLTPEGKYGCIYINNTGFDYDGKHYISISIKRQK